MGKLVVDTGIENLIREFGDIAEKTNGVLKQGLYEGAAMEVDAVKTEIRNLPAPITDREREALLSGIGISKMRATDDGVDVCIGFTGYDDHPTKSYPQGQPIPMLARAIHGGTSWRTKRPFVTKAKNKSKAMVEKAITDTIEKKVEELTRR